MVSYHERGRLRPEGVRVIAHVHYACESYLPGEAPRGAHGNLATAKDLLRTLEVARGALTKV